VAQKKTGAALSMMSAIRDHARSSEDLSWAKAQVSFLQVCATAVQAGSISDEGSHADSAANANSADTAEGKATNESKLSDTVIPKVADFQGESIAGDPFKMESLRGRWVLLNFWASWCPACRKKLPQLVDVYQGFPRQSVEFVSVNMDDDVEVAKAFLTEQNIQWRQLKNKLIKADGGAATLTEEFHISAIPSFVLLNPESEIVRSDFESVTEIETELRERLDSPKVMIGDLSSSIFHGIASGVEADNRLYSPSVHSGMSLW
jgi:thiol-disulfide isomerase/thioredoxin